MRLIVGHITAYEERGWVRVVMKAAREFLWEFGGVKAALHRQRQLFFAPAFPDERTD